MADASQMTGNAYFTRISEYCSTSNGSSPLPVPKRTEIYDKSCLQLVESWKEMHYSECDLEISGSGLRPVALSFFTEPEVATWIKNGFHYIHLAELAIVLHPHFNYRLQAPYWIAVIDRRFKTFEEAIITQAKGTLASDAVIVTIPNFTLSLHDPHLYKSLMIIVYLPVDMLPRSIYATISTRLMFKVFNSTAIKTLYPYNQQKVQVGSSDIEYGVEIDTEDLPIHHQYPDLTNMIDYYFRLEKKRGLPTKRRYKVNLLPPKFTDIDPLDHLHKKSKPKLFQKPLTIHEQPQIPKPEEKPDLALLQNTILALQAQLSQSMRKSDTLHLEMERLKKKEKAKIIEVDPDSSDDDSIVSSVKSTLFQKSSGDPSCQHRILKEIGSKYHCTECDALLKTCSIEMNTLSDNTFTQHQERLVSAEKAQRKHEFVQTAVEGEPSEHIYTLHTKKASEKPSDTICMLNWTNTTLNDLVYSNRTQMSVLERMYNLNVNTDLNTGLIYRKLERLAGSSSTPIAKVKPTAPPIPSSASEFSFQFPGSPPAVTLKDIEEFKQKTRENRIRKGKFISMNEGHSDHQSEQGSDQHPLSELADEHIEEAVLLARTGEQVQEATDAMLTQSRKAGDIQPKFNMDNKDLKERQDVLDAIQSYLTIQIDFAKKSTLQAIVNATYNFQGNLRRWWSHIPTAIKTRLITQPTVIFLNAIIKEFIGFKANLVDVYRDRFFKARLHKIQQLSGFLDAMESWYYYGKLTHEVAAKEHLFGCLPQPFCNTYMAELKKQNLCVANMSFGQIRQFLEQTNRELCYTQETQQLVKRLNNRLGKNFCLELCPEEKYKNKEKQQKTQKVCKSCKGSSSRSKPKKQWRRKQSSPPPRRHVRKYPGFFRRRPRRMSPKNIKCFICGGPHLATNCPNKDKDKKKVHFITKHNIKETHFEWISDPEDIEIPYNPQSDICPSSPSEAEHSEDDYWVQYNQQQPLADYPIDPSDSSDGDIYYCNMNRGSTSRPTQQNKELIRIQEQLVLVKIQLEKLKTKLKRTPLEDLTVYIQLDKQVTEKKAEVKALRKLEKELHASYNSQPLTTESEQQEELEEWLQQEEEQMPSQTKGLEKHQIRLLRINQLKLFLTKASKELESLEEEEEKYQQQAYEAEISQIHIIRINQNQHRQVQTPLCTFWIKLKGFKPYPIDALIDSGAEVSLANEAIIPSFLWKPREKLIVSFNKTATTVNRVFSLPILLPNSERLELQVNAINWLSYDMVIGVDNLAILEPYTIHTNFVTLGNHKFTRTFTPVNRFTHTKYKVPKTQWLINHIQSHKEVFAQLRTKLLTVASDDPTAFRHKKQHWCRIELLDGIQPQSKAHHIGMSPQLKEECAQEIKQLLEKKMIQPSTSMFSCAAFYVNKRAELTRGKKRLVVNYKPLNAIIKSVQHPIPSKDDLFQRLQGTHIYSKFDLKSGFWQIQIVDKDRWKTAFTVPQGLYEWTVLPFGIKTAPSIFQSCMDHIFKEYPFILVYIDDILVMSKTVEEHQQHLNTLYELLDQNGLVLSPSEKKMQIAVDEVNFLGVVIKNGHISLQQHILTDIKHFPDIITDKTQLQRFLGCLNYLSGFYKDLAKDRKILNQQLTNNPQPWSQHHTDAVQRLKDQCTKLPYLRLPTNGTLILETDASEEFWGAVLKEEIHGMTYICRYASGKFISAEMNYHSTHKELLAIIRGIEKFRLFLQEQEFIIRSDLKYFDKYLQTKHLNKVAHTRLIRWSLFLANFTYRTQYISGKDNNLADYLTREFQY